MSDPVARDGQSPEGAPSWKAVSRPDEHADFAGQMMVTRDERTIVEWASARRASPLVLDDDQGDRLDTLILDFPGHAPPAEGRAVSWDEWLRIFTTQDLRFIFQEHANDGSVSNYYRLDPSSREEGTGRAHTDGP